MMLMITATITMPPKVIDRIVVGKTAISVAPATAPGTRPTIAAVSPEKSIKTLFLYDIIIDNIKTENITGPGTIMGSIKISGGTTISARPKPIEPWTAAPIVMMIQTINASTIVNGKSSIRLIYSISSLNGLPSISFGFGFQAETSTNISPAITGR
jgi:hypothetical protein